MGVNGQKERIYRMLQAGRNITAIDALNEAGSMKLSTRIGEIEKEMGIKVQRKMVRVPSGKLIMSYWL